MKKTVPDPPVLSVRQDLPSEQAAALAADHLRKAALLAQQFAGRDYEAITQSITLQVEIATDLLAVAMANDK